MAAVPDDPHQAVPDAVQLDDATIDAIAARVVELLGVQVSTPAGMLTASQIAARFGVSRSWVYENATYLGAMRLGDGARPRLRFDPNVVADRLSRADAGHPIATPPAGSASSLAKGDLIPIRGL